MYFSLFLLSTPLLNIINTTAKSISPQPMKRIFLIIALIAAWLPCQAQRLYVTDFDAKGDGVTLCTRNLQAAIDSANATYRRTGTKQTVVVPPGQYVSGTLYLLSGVTLHLMTGKIPYHAEALEMADMGLVPAGAYRNRNFAQASAEVRGDVPRALQDILYDPQTSGGLLIAVDERDAEALLKELHASVPEAAVIGYAAEKEEKALILEG